MKMKNILYVFLMIIFIILAYFFMDRGINTKTKIFVNYQDNSNVIYKVFFDDGKYANMGERYARDKVDYIGFEYDFKRLFSSKINGYYSYNIDCNLIAYNKDIDDILYQKRYILLNDIVETLSNNGNNININSKINVEYKKYRDELKSISKEYGENINGYLELRFNIFESLNFNGMDNVKEDNKQIKVIIPLGYDNFKINVINEKKNIDSFYDFSKKQSVNYLLMVLGAFSLSLGISFFALVIRNLVIIYKSENRYNKKLKEIFNSYGDIIVNVKKFYNKKKYNLIYVDSFNELMDVYNKVRNPISYKEIKKNSECIFLLMDGDNAWIYKMNNK